jgi:hypothetical protein
VGHSFNKHLLQLAQVPVEIQTVAPEVEDRITNPLAWPVVSDFAAALYPQDFWPLSREEFWAGSWGSYLSSQALEELGIRPCPQGVDRRVGEQ